jgi:peroxiredoxin
MATTPSTPPSSLDAALAELRNAASAEATTVLDRGIDEIRQSGAAPGLQVGDPAPDFTLPDQLGREVHLADQLAQGPVVLVFYRGEWCPYCNLTLKHLQDHLAAIERLGAGLIAISPQTPDKARTLAERHTLRFSVLSDAMQDAIRAYRLQYTLPPDTQDLYVHTFGNDLRRQTADGSWNLPVSGTFVVDRAGIIRARFVDADYRRRVEAADILAVLADLDLTGSRFPRASELA